MRSDLRANDGALRQLDGVALAVGEADGLDASVAVERPGQADGGVLPAGKQHQCGTFGHATFIYNAAAQSALCGIP